MASAARPCTVGMASRKPLKEMQPTIKIPGHDGGCLGEFKGTSPEWWLVPVGDQLSGKLFSYRL